MQKNIGLEKAAYKEKLSLIWIKSRGKCNCCKVSLNEWNLNTHHKNPKLPLSKVNKVMNLVSLCKTCHKLVHNENPITNTKGGKKIEQLRKLLKEGKQVRLSRIN